MGFLLLLSFYVGALQAAYFNYEKVELPKESIYEVTIEELINWENVGLDALNESGPSARKLMLMAYLKMAQNDFVELGSGKGSVGYLSYHIIKLFKPDLPLSNYAKGMDDPYSKKLGDLVFAKYEKRFKEEKIQPQVLQGGAGWDGKKPYFGLDSGSIAPWYINKSDYLCLTPPVNETFWALQMDEVELRSSNVSEKDKENIDFWAGPEGDLLKIADKHMYEANTPIIERAKIRAVLASAHSDACSCCFLSKYTYLVKRPFMYQAGFKPVIETPNHPSYPSAHSTNASAQVVLLDYYLPNPKWKRLANEAGLSRIIGGLHYPIDHVNGQELGTRIGKAVLDDIKSRSKP